MFIYVHVCPVDTVTHPKVMCASSSFGGYIVAKKKKQKGGQNYAYVLSLEIAGYLLRLV